MDVHFTFNDIFDDNGVLQWTFGGWIGKYTIGNINIRGTRLWFRPPFVKSCGIDMEENIEKELLEGKSTFPGDYCNLRGDSLDKILCELKERVVKPEKCEYYKGTIKGLLIDKKSRIDNYEFEEFLACETFKYDEILINAGPDDISDVWLINNKDEIIAELEHVLNKCNEEGVTWVWI